MCDSLDCRRILILNWGPFLVISRSMFSFLSVCTFEQPNKIVITKLQLYIYNWYELNKSSVNWLQQTESFLAVIWITSFSSLVNILITNVVTSEFLSRLRTDHLYVHEKSCYQPNFCKFNSTVITSNAMQYTSKEKLKKKLCNKKTGITCSRDTNTNSLTVIMKSFIARIMLVEQLEWHSTCLKILTQESRIEKIHGETLKKRIQTV